MWSSHWRRPHKGYKSYLCRLEFDFFKNIETIDTDVCVGLFSDSHTPPKRLGLRSSLRHSSVQFQESSLTMEAQIQESVVCRPQVKVQFQLGSEAYSVSGNKGILSQQLVSVKEESMTILKDFITKHNVPNDVPDELVENSSEDDDDILEKPQVKSKKTKLT